MADGLHRYGLGVACVGMGMLAGCAGAPRSAQRGAGESRASATAQPSAPEVPEAKGGPYAQLVRYDFGQSRESLVAVEDQVRQARPEQYPAIEGKLIEVLRNPETKYAGKDFALRMLAKVGSGACVSAVAPLLTDEKLSHMARYAIQDVKDPAAGKALRDALGKAQGKVNVGLISSLGDRRDAAAVPALESALRDRDPAVAAAAIEALGDIGEEAAIKALGDAEGSVPEGLRGNLDKARVNLAMNLARDGKASAAAAVYQSLLKSKDATVRAAAVQGLISVGKPGDSIKLIEETLAGQDELAREAALTAVGSGPKALRAAIAEQLPTLKPEAQRALIPVVTQRDIEARPALVKILEESKDKEVRVAAIAAMVDHAKAQDVPLLLSIAAVDDQNDAERGPAREVLRRIGGKGVDEALIAAAEGDHGPKKVAAVRALVDRKTESALPVLIKLTGGEGQAATEAAQGLAGIGTSKELPQLADVLMNAKGDAQRDAAAKAIQSICLRAADKDNCSRAVVAAIKKAEPAGRKALMPAMSRIGNAEALAALREQVREEKDAELQTDAVRELAAWPDFAAVPTLVELAKSAEGANQKVLALRGLIRLARESKGTPADVRVETLRTAFVLAKRPEDKSLALAGLGDIAAPSALQLLMAEIKNKDIAADAASNAIRLAKQLGVLNRQKSIDALKAIKADAPNDAIAKQADEAIAAVEKMADANGYLIAWMLSGPYTQEGKDGAALFNVAFDPEKKDATGVKWQPVLVANPDANDHQVHLDKILGGNERVAYLKTVIHSAKAQQVTLELGSDDGAKVWLDGKQVHAKNAARPVKEGEDKVKLELKEGANPLLVKVTQGGGEWALVARLRSAAGGNPEGVSVSAE